MFARQATQTWAALHAGVEVPAQSALVLHCTQVDVWTSQWGAGTMHDASVVHPIRQRKVPGSQTGAAVPQSAFDRHATHSPFAEKQRGVAAGQSVFVAHATHVSVVGSHTFVAPEQSADVLHPTHAPVVVSQSWFFPAQSAVVVHAARHMWVDGEQTGAFAEHPKAPEQGTQAPLAQ